MNKSEFVESVSTKSNLSKKDVSSFLDAMTQTITESLSKGNTVSFIGFGTFSTAQRGARNARVPSTGEKVEVPATTVAKFKVGSKLKEAVK